MQLRLTILLLCFLSEFLCIGSNQIDSLLSALNNGELSNEEKVNTYCRLANENSKIDSFKASIHFYNEALNLSNQLNNDSLKVEVLNYMFNFYYVTKVRDLKKAKELLYEIIQINEKNGTTILLAESYQRLSTFLRDEGQLSEAVVLNSKAFELFEKEDNKRGLAGCYNQYAILANLENKRELTLKYFLKANSILKQIGDEISEARLSTNIGKMYFHLGLKDSSDKYFDRSMEIWNKLGRSDLMAVTKINLSQIYSAEGENQDLNYAKKLLEEAKESLIKINDTKYLSDVYVSLANIENRQNKIVKAIFYMKKAIELAESESYKKKLEDNYLHISKMYFSVNDYKNAYENIAKYVHLNNELDSISKAEELARLQIQFDTKEKEKEIENLKKDKEVSDLTIAKQEREQIMALLGILLVVAIAVFIFIGYRNKAKLNSELTEKNIVIQEKNKEILDSITYAKRLQEAILPPTKLVKEWLPESFIFYKPKDIVSGDFYWMESIHDKIYFAAIDCTGHGVPGAMVSLVGHNAINRCIKEFNLTKPSEILDKLSYLVEESLSKSNEEVKDGMDISLCALDLKTYSIEFSGANNPLWVLRDSELIEIKGDKQPIGKHIERKAFTNHQITLQKNDSVYLFTDGYADQFGGEKGKKFKYSQFKELLISIQNESMEKQRELISESFESWKGKLEQLDDVCVIGVRV